MLKLKNIKVNNGIVSAEYEPENSGDIGIVSVDTTTMKVVESKPSKMDEGFPVYLNHAIDWLKKMANKPDLPSEKLVMWH